MKWRPTCYEMVPDKLENGAQCCFSKFNCRLFISKFSQFAFYLSLSLSVISKIYPNFAASVATTRLVLCWMCDLPRTGCTWRATPIYMCRKQAEIEWGRRGISIVACCHNVKLCILAAWAFQSQQSGALTRMWRWCQVQPSQKECAIGAVHYKKEGTLLQPLSWCCVECAIHHKWGVRKQQHTNMCDVNKQ